MYSLVIIINHTEKKLIILCYVLGKRDDLKHSHKKKEMVTVRWWMC